MPDPDLFSLVQLKDWLATHGVVRSRQELQRRAHEKQFGQKVGQQYVITLSEAKDLLARLQTKGS